MCDHLDRDHIFVAVRPGLELEISATSAVGLVRSSRVDRIADTAAASAMCRFAESVVVSCLDTESARGRLFAPGWRSGRGGLTRRERAASAGVTGRVGEPVIEVLLGLGAGPAAAHDRAGMAGVDPVLLVPGDVVVRSRSRAPWYRAEPPAC